MVMIDVIIIEYRVEAMVIPNNISFNDIGETKIRSNDFSRVSIGNTTGLIAVAVKNDVIDTIPINTRFIEISLPITQESVIKKGNIRPKIKTGPLFMYSETFFLLNIQIRFKLSAIIIQPPIEIESFFIRWINTSSNDVSFTLKSEMFKLFSLKKLYSIDISLITSSLEKE